MIIDEDSLDDNPTDFDFGNDSNECLNCGDAIQPDASFCDYRCEQIYYLNNTTEDDE